MNTFKRNLLLGYGVSLVILVGSSIASYFSINSLLFSAAEVNHTTTVARKLEKVLSILKDAETGQRGFLITGNEIFLEPYRGAEAAASATVAEIKALTKDNSQQQEDCEKLGAVATTRIEYLSFLVNRKRRQEAINDSLMLVGKSLMDSARSLIRTMSEREEALLKTRTEKLNRFAASTPILIVIASLLAIIVTVISLLRLLKDHKKRMELQQSLLQKDEEISQRLAIIENISNQVSSGNYKVKVDDERRDMLGSIAGSLNIMADSLDKSFTSLSQREWLQTGVASLNELVIGEQDITSLGHAVLEFVAEYSGSRVGAFYVITNDGSLELKSSFALSASHKKNIIQRGEGLAGQAAISGKIMEVKDIAESAYTLSYVSGEIKPTTVIAIPLLFNRRVKGVIELAAMDEYTPIMRSFFEAVSFNTAIAINTAQGRQKVQELLEETQAQTEELQAQHSELENINAELEAQAEKLQASEEELKVQQEELQQANSELEERSRLLEEKNEMILERNLEIQGKAEELAQSTKYKSEFLANMSHELRTPLNSILLLSRLLGENHSSNLSSDQLEYANVIQSSGNGLLKLIDEILDLSKIEAGKMELEYADVSITALVSDLQSIFTPIAVDKGIEFSVDVSKGITGPIETDRLRLEQVLRNLISNALKFTKKGSVKLNIEKQDGLVAFSVTDTGIGIPKEKQRTIFEAFQQADGSTRRQFGGTGLGLSISRELVRLLGGEIQLQSEEGKGSVFTVLIPAVKRPMIAPDATETGPPIQSPSVKSNIVHTKAPQYISDSIPQPVADDRDAIHPGDKVLLIIEDDTAFAKSLLEYTRSKGYKGVVAVRGDEGIELATLLLPMGILLDIQLPVKSGWEVMDELKSNPATRPIPVHIMSSQHAKTKSLLKGAVDFIDKPVAFEKLGEMFAKIEDALTRHPKKVMIVEENAKHAQALAYFLQQYNVASEIKNSVRESIVALSQQEVDCVILDMGIPAQHSYDTLEQVKKTPGLENVPIIIFTGKNLSHTEEMKIKQYAETIVVKTAHSYQRILDEVSVFLHLVEENNKDTKIPRYKRMGDLEEVLKGKTILVVDDDVRNIFSLTKSLEKYDMKVVSAIDGKEALNQLEANNNVNLVLMDMMMPEMDGYESTRRIRKMPVYRNLPIIAITAKAMTGDREKCISAGASDYITKPVDMDQLISLLRVWLYQ
jgi:signal transduction histidine kinase/DNA-binding response OmpR family regulator/CHASE3 domain sensor protein